MTQFFRPFLDLLFPPSCLSCGLSLPSSRVPLFCQDCFSRLRFISSPLCPCCGRLFQNGAGGDHFCGPCLTQKRHFRAARALLLYEDPIKPLIQQLKYHKKTFCLPSLAALMASSPNAFANEDVELILPVPLHKKKLRQRGFNQAQLLAESFFPRDLRLKADILFRIKETTAQTGLSGDERRRNMGNAFAVPAPEAVRGKRILLIDDVFTTGTTVNECAKTLLKAGASDILVLTLARVTEG